MHYADEVRSADDIKPGSEVKVRANEVELARRLVEQLSVDEFQPEQYKDEYRDRVQGVVQKKVAGEEVTAAEPEQPRAQVIDLMEALKASLAGKSRTARDTPVCRPDPRGYRHQAAARRFGTSQRDAGAAASSQEVGRWRRGGRRVRAPSSTRRRHPASRVCPRPGFVSVCAPGW